MTPDIEEVKSSRENQLSVMAVGAADCLKRAEFVSTVRIEKLR